MYQNPYHLLFSMTDKNIRTVIILFLFICLLYTHIRVRLMNVCGDSDLFV